jgi:proteic killer suppression protein
VIRSFRCRDTEKLYHRQRVSRFVSIEQFARRKLRLLDSAVALRDVATPPGNRLEAWHGDRKGHYRIRVNDQWRICFEWRDADAYEVEIVDYH